MTLPSRRTVALGIAGAGRAGGACAAALRPGGSHPLEVFIWDRHPQKARTLARQTRHRAVADLNDFLGRIDELIIAVRDDALPAFTRQLMKEWPTGKGPRAVVHMAGALPASVLAPLKRHGAHLGVFQPVVPLAGPVSGKSLPLVSATVSGIGPRGLRAARQICRRVGCRPLPIDDAQRPLFHAGAVMASGDLVAWLGEALALWEFCGIPPSRARLLLRTLANEALRQFTASTPGKALTGPAARGDAATLLSHMQALSGAGNLGIIALQVHPVLAIAGAKAAAREGLLTPRILRRLASELSRAGLPARKAPRNLKRGASP